MRAIMKNNIMKKILLGALCLPFLMQAQEVKLDVDVTRRGIEISPTHYGLFFEDINHAADGGLYAELIRNRSFEDADIPDYWSKIAPSGTTVNLSLETNNLLNEVQGKALKIVVTGATSAKRAGVSNVGFWGINAVKDRVYKVSFFAKCTSGYKGKFTVGLTNQNGDLSYGSTTLEEETSSEWKKYTCSVTSTGNDPQAKFVWTVDAPGTVYLDVVSLFPPTFKDRENGCRPELAQLLADMKPRFMRFPGGCFVEGNSQENGFYWKKTVGPIEEREGHWNQWGYRTSDGMGYHEFLQLCEDLEATPLYVVNIGIWHGGYQDYRNIGTYVQDALDAIEYANGDATTKYGAMRIANGHPEPFNLRLIEIGNENYQASASQQSDRYAERYLQFYTAIKDKYPYMQLIGNVEAWGTDDPTWRNSNPVDILDEHYYRTPGWFAAQYNKYDSYSRAGAKIYAGEYAVTSNCGNGNLNAALGEAVYMCGMENNSDVVTMNSYAPIFRNDNVNHWAIDMIHFNSAQYYCTPSYYVQKMFPNNIGTRIVKWTETGDAQPSVSRIGVGSWSTAADYEDVNVATPEGEILFSDDFSSDKEWIPGEGVWKLQDGVYSQTSTSTNCTSIAAPELAVSSYIYHVKARKNSGAEGFLVIFNYKDAENYCWWNLGGWGNKTHGIEVCNGGAKNTVASAAGTLETGRWYDIRIEVKGEEVKCYLDNKLVHSVTIPLQKPFYTTVSLDEKSNELYLKLVNPSSTSTRAAVTVKGIGSLSEGQVTVLSAMNGLVENSMSEPENVVPVTEPLSVNGVSFTYEIPGYSANVLKLKLSGVQPPVREEPETLPAPAVSYSFDGGTAQDDKASYVGTLENGACIMEVAGNKMLFTGSANGYMDLGKETGKKVFGTLNDFTLSTNIYSEPDNNLDNLGNFICCFSSLNPVIYDSNRNQVQYIFLGAKSLSYTVNNKNYSAQQSTGHLMNLPSAKWYNVTYVQKGSVGTLYLNGAIVQQNANMTITPSDMANNFVYNWLGRSCWQGDNYLKNAYIDDFQVYATPFSGNQVKQLSEGLSKRDAEMELYQTLRAIDLGDLTQVKGDLLLPSSLKGNPIVWTSSAPDIISAEGKVNRPAPGEKDAEVILTATVTSDGSIQTKEFAVTVCHLYDDKGSVESDTEALQIPEGYLKNTRWYLPLDTVGEKESMITWESSAPEYIDSKGRLLKLSMEGQPQEKVKLTATIAKGEESRTKTFEATIAYPETRCDGYLFAYFEGSGTGNLQEQLRFGASADGVNWNALNNNQPIIASDTISKTGGIRDPHILRGEDGNTFFIVATDMFVNKNGWGSNPGIVLLKSDNLTDWTHAYIDLSVTYPERFGDAHWVWAPQTIYDPSAGKYMIYFTLKRNTSNDLVTYYAYANDDFTAFESEPKVLFSAFYGSIDNDIIYKDGVWHLFYKGNTKDASGNEIKNGIQQAMCPTLHGKWTEDFKYLDVYAGRTPVEGSGIFKLNNSEEYVLMYDLYTSQRYEYQKSSDLYDFGTTSYSFTKNFNPRHGTVMGITRKEAQALDAKWGGVPGALTSISVPQMETSTLKMYQDGRFFVINVEQTTLVSICAMDGALIYSKALHAGEQCSLSLSPGSYLVNGVKCMVTE